MNSKSLAASALITSVLAAQSNPPPIPIELRARFGFTGPLVQKIGYGINSLEVGDIDGDGKVEAITFDARRARIVAVSVDDGATSKLTIPTGGQIADFAIGDFTGNDQAQVVIVDSRGRMSLRNQDGSTATRPFELGLSTRGLNIHAADLDKDGKDDLVAYANGKMRVITNVSDKPKLTPIEPTEKTLYSLNLIDLDGDQNLDITCIVPGDDMNMRMRLGNGDGTFGAWRVARMDALSSAFEAKLSDGTPVLATVGGGTRRVAVHSYSDHGEQAAPEWWAFGEADSTKTPPFTVGDIDNDNDDDLIIFPRDRAQMVVYEWRDGTFIRRALPSFAGVSSVTIGDVDQDGKKDIVITSPEEEAVAWISGATPLDRFPEQLPSTDLPVSAAVDPSGGVLVLTRDKSRKANLLHVAKGSEPKKLASLGRMGSDPLRVIAADVGDRDGLEVSFVVPGVGLRTVSIATDRASETKAKAKASAGFTRKMTDGSLMVSDQDGKPALIAVREQFVRSFRFDENEQIRVLDQDNGPDGTTELSLACQLGKDQWMFFDKKSNKLLRTEPGQPAATAEIPKLAFTNLVAHHGAGLLIGARGVMRVAFQTGPSLKAVATHEPPTDKTYYWIGRTGDFDGDKIPDLAMIDRRLPGVQILAGGKEGIKRALAIPVFETRPSASPNNEPRALATGDLDGDGRCDLVLIAHDRILIYLQDK